MSALEATEFECAQRVIKKDTWDRSLLILVEGQLIAFNEDGENTVLEEGAIIGA